MGFRDSPAMALRAAYLTMHRRFQTLFASAGVTADQYVVLSLLAEDDGLIQKELVRRTCSDANTTTAILRLLEAQRLVRRAPHADDARARQVFLTPKGRKLQAKLRSRSEALHRRWTDEFAPGERTQLLALLGRVVAAYESAQLTAADK